MAAGYSGTPLVKKLGIKPGMRVTFVNAPEGYSATLGSLPPGVAITAAVTSALDFIQFFTNSREELTRYFPMLKGALSPNGMLWISWYKKAAKRPTELTEDIVREIGLANGLVDVKVAAVDDLWSGLKFVYRLEDRQF